MSKVDREALLEKITEFYLESSGFNGIPALSLVSQFNLNRDDLELPSIGWKLFVLGSSQSD